MKKMNLKRLVKADSESFEELSNDMKNALYHIQAVSQFFNEDRPDVFSTSEISVLENMAKRLNKMIDDIDDVEEYDYVSDWCGWSA